MNSILLRLVISQFKLFFREPGVVFWSFGFPVLMAWILGIAFASKGEILRNVAVVSNNQVSDSTLPEWLLKKTGIAPAEFSGDYELVWEVGENHGEQARFRFRAMSKKAAMRALKRGQITLWIERTPETDLRYRFDPNNAEARLTYFLLEGVSRKQKFVRQKAEV